MYCSVVVVIIISFEVLCQCLYLKGLNASLQFLKIINTLDPHYNEVIGCHALYRIITRTALY